MAARWFLLVDGAQQGPFDLARMRDRVRDGALGPDAWVWADGMPTWRRAGQVPALCPPPSVAADLPAWRSVAGPRGRASGETSSGGGAAGTGSSRAGS